ncbi:hypothetical protein HY772_09430 [Candidatus Woesearchaeota archaeon]|nr:hypothetical protein [Candidatus Woesearchaeota archaeon]
MSRISLSAAAALVHNHGACSADVSTDLRTIGSCIVSYDSVYSWSLLELNLYSECRGDAAK